MADHIDIATRLVVDSDIIRVYPGATVELYTSGTSSLITSEVADANGVWTVASLAIGHYDIKVDGQLVGTLHHVPYDHIHTPDETWSVFDSGAISADRDADVNHPSFIANVAGSIVKVQIVAQSAAVSCDVYVHILKKAADGSAAATIASDSVWSHRINNTGGATVYRYKHTDTSPSISLAANDVVTTGIDYVAAGVSGVNVIMIFRPS